MYALSPICVKYTFTAQHRMISTERSHVTDVPNGLPTTGKHTRTHRETDRQTDRQRDREVQNRSSTTKSKNSSFSRETRPIGYRAFYSTAAQAIIVDPFKPYWHRVH